MNIVASHFTRIVACAMWIAVILFTGGCATDPTMELADPAALGPDFRNGWYHWATGAQSVQEVAAIYGRDVALTSNLNRTRAEAIPAPNTAIYIPPVHDKATLRQILTRINADPSLVPLAPPTAAEFLSADQMMAFIMQPEPVVAVPIEPQPAAIEPIITETQELQVAAVEPEPVAVETSTTLPTEQTSSPDVTAMPLEAAPVPTRVYSLKEAQERNAAQKEAAKTMTAQAGQFNWPLQGKIIRPYSTSGAEPFPAIAIEAPEGTPIFSSREGKVIFAGVLEGYGNVIILEHGGGLTSVYGYASLLQVKVKKQVVAGEQIALVGRPSVGSPSQLYFQIRRNGRPVNPLELLR